MIAFYKETLTCLNSHAPQNLSPILEMRHAFMLSFPTTEEPIFDDIYYMDEKSNMGSFAHWFRRFIT